MRAQMLRTSEKLIAVKCLNQRMGRFVIVAIKITRCVRYLSY